MKYTCILVAAIIALNISCGRTSRDSTAENTVIEAVEESNEHASRYFSSGGRDLVESMYAELLEKSADLKQLERRLDNLNEKKDDSMSVFNEYLKNNKSYYADAEIHARHISDSLLQDRVSSIITQSEERFNKTTALHQSLRKQVAQKEKEINDLHETIKVLSTLPVIEEYQQKSLPSSGKLQRLLMEMNRVKADIDSLTRLKKL